MSTQQRTARRPAAAGPRRETAWNDTTVNDSLVSEGSQFLRRTSDFTTEDGSTLVRTLICLSIQPVTPAGQTFNLQLVSIGIGVTSQEAFNAGVVPDPDVDVEQPVLGWVYKCKWNVLENAGADSPPLLVEKNIKAARKLARGTCYIVGNNKAGAGTPFTIRVFGLIRQLYMLP